MSELKLLRHEQDVLAQPYTTRALEAPSVVETSNYKLNYRTSWL